MEAINARAAQLVRDSTDRLPAGVARFSALADLILGERSAGGRTANDGGGSGHPVLEGFFTIPLTTWLGLTHNPGELSGYGPITAETARELSEDASFRLMITDPVSGQLLAMGRTRYRPTPALTRYVRAQYRSCQFPGCERPATSCDLDHIQEWDRGGTTDPDNLHPLCRRHHNLKTDKLWSIEVNPDGSQTWISPMGFRHAREPASYHLEPLGEPPETEDIPVDIASRVPDHDPCPPPGIDDPLPDAPTISLEEYLSFSDDLERRAFWCANSNYDRCGDLLSS
jgi:HNH endonuclease/Domain of unknown function (DUF222)